MASEVLKYRSFDAQLMIQYSEFASDSLGRDFWVVLKSFSYYTGKKEDLRTITVPAGYLSDGASSPRVVWWLVPPMGRYGQAAVVHDYLCEYLMINDRGVMVPITRKEADKIFLEAMKVLGVPAIVRYTMYYGVTAHRVMNGITKPKRCRQKIQAEKQVREHFERYGSYF